MRYCRRRRFLVKGIRPILFLLACLSLAFTAISAYFLWIPYRVTQWPTVEATVQKTSWKAGYVTEHERKMSRSYSPDVKREVRVFYPRIQYGYAVDGKDYTGSKIRTSRIALGSIKAIRAWQGLYPVGRKIDVRVNPDAPGEAYLKAHFKRIWLWWPVSGVAFTIVLLLCARAVRIANAPRDDGDLRRRDHNPSMGAKLLLGLAGVRVDPKGSPCGDDEERMGS